MNAGVHSSRLEVVGKGFLSCVIEHCKSDQLNLPWGSTPVHRGNPARIRFEERRRRAGRTPNQFPTHSPSSVVETNMTPSKSFNVLSVNMFGSLRHQTIPRVE